MAIRGPRQEGHHVVDADVAPHGAGALGAAAGARPGRRGAPGRSAPRPSCRWMPSWASASTRSRFTAPSRAKTLDERRERTAGIRIDREGRGPPRPALRSDRGRPPRTGLPWWGNAGTPSPPHAGAAGDLVERRVRALGGKRGAGGLEHAVPVAPGVGAQRAGRRAVDGRGPGAGGGGVGSSHRTDLLPPLVNGAFVPYSVSGVIVPFPSEASPRPPRGTAMSEQTDQQELRGSPRASAGGGARRPLRRPRSTSRAASTRTGPAPCSPRTCDWSTRSPCSKGIEEVAAAHRMVMGRWERTLHFTTNHRIEFDGDRAHLTARLMAIHVHPGENPPDSLIAANVLDADAVRTSGRVALRAVRPSHRLEDRTVSRAPRGERR